MSVEGFYTVEEQRALVYEYLSVPHGSKARFLAERGLKKDRLLRWRRQVLADTLEQGLVPRAGVGLVSIEETAALKRLLEENKALRAQVAVADKKIAARDEELATQRRAVDALGKAIEILHLHGPDKISNNNNNNDGGTSGVNADANSETQVVLPSDQPSDRSGR